MSVNVKQIGIRESQLEIEITNQIEAININRKPVVMVANSHKQDYNFNLNLDDLNGLETKFVAGMPTVKINNDRKLYAKYIELSKRSNSSSNKSQESDRQEEKF